MDKNIVHGLSSKEDALASRKSIIHRFNVPVSAVLEPKPACDHIVGKAVFYYNIGEYETLECHVSELSKVKWKKEINRKRENTFVWHKHCHECGEKLNLKKDE